MKKYCKVVWKEIVVRLLFHVVYTTAIAALPYVIKNMIDCKFERGMQDIIKWIVIFIACIIIGMMAQYITQKSAWLLDKKFYIEIRKDLFNVIMSKEPEDFDEKEVGEYSSNMVNDIAACEEYVEYFMQIFESIIGLIIYAFYIFMLDKKIAVIIYTTAVLTLFLPRLTGKKLASLKQQLLGEIGNYTNILLDLFKSYLFIDRFTLKNVNERHKHALYKLENSRYRYGKYKTFTNVLNGMAMYMINVAAFVIIAILLSKKAITVGVATATISYIQDFMFPLRTIVDTISSVKSVSGVKTKVISDIKQSREVPAEEVFFKERITLKNICKAWSNCDIVDFSCTFEKGKSYLITGDSGTGKSSLLNILTQTIRQDKGEILIDHTRGKYDMCKEIMFYIKQNSNVYSECYRDNCTMYETYSYEELLEKITGDNSYNSIYHSMNCNMLSGGEKQLVMLSRAILSQKEVLVLDEPFSALNSELEVQVTKYLLGLGKTVIMVSHNTNEEYKNLFDNVICL